MNALDWMRRGVRIACPMGIYDHLAKVSAIGRTLQKHRLRADFREIFRKFHDYTMIHESKYISNLELVWTFRNVSGCVVECGVWRGGMIAGIADVLGPERHYFLFDSFEGLPPAREIDGKAALAWQSNLYAQKYRNNCAATENEAGAAMKLSRATSYSLVKGWFNETVPTFNLPSQIAVLRLDGDWYDSTRVCLQSLVPQVADGGVIIVDDYYEWNGCARAVNEFISCADSPDEVLRVRQFHDRVAYMVKSGSGISSRVHIANSKN
jgi:O-methyltransferase